MLADCSVLELVRTRQVRGSMQHFYRSLLEAEWALFALGIGDGRRRMATLRGEEIG